MNRITRKKELYAECCVCIRKANNQKTHTITKKVSKTQTQTIYDIIIDLNLINYEITSKENELICESCRKIVVDFYNFKVMCENQQNSHRVSTKKEENKDQVKDLMESTHYEKLLKFIKQFPHSAVTVDEENQLIISPHKSKIKNEYESYIDMNFVDFQNTELIVKTEIDETEERLEDIENDDEDYRMDSNEMSNDDDISSDEEEEEKQSTVETITTEEGVSKTILNNIEFISRTPECLVDLMKKKKEGKSKYKNPENWIRIKQRTARAKGKAYTTRSGKFIRAREMKAACNKCRYKCCEKITEAERLKNFQNYWNLADFILQKKFLFEHRIVEPVARRRARQENPRIRSYSTKYFLDTFNEDGSFKEMIKVCEAMFTNTLDICKNTIRTLQKKVEMGKVEDLRGQQRRKLSPGHVIALEHIKQFPYFHIEKPMPLTQMYKVYVQECFEKNVEPVKDGTYRKLFTDNNECEFLRQSTKFKCEVCDQYNQASDYDKISMEFNYKYHLETNPQCMKRDRWRKNGKIKAERRKSKLMIKQQQQQMQNQQQSYQQQTVMEFIEDIQNL